MNTRRRLLTLLASLFTPHAMAQTAATPSHEPFGPVRPPLPAPKLTLTGEDDRRFELGARLRGRISAVQLMFTGCSATCPIQGALFGALAPLVADHAEWQLLSLSIDPLGDSPRALRTWRARFATNANWLAAVPRVEEVDRLLDFLRGRAQGADRHTAQIYLFDRQARLAYRTADMPPARFVADLMNELSQLR
ncbi:MAG: SCO family protein [Burkholderiales bacterium]